MRPPRVLLQADEHAGARQQIEVVRQRRRVAGILQLAEHLRVGEDLARVSAAQLGLSTRDRRSTSREMVVSMSESRT